MKFLSSDECKTLFAGREIYVFGAGAFGEIFHKKLGDVITVCAFIDNHRSGKGNYLCGKEIISLEQYKIRRTKEQPIIVSAYRHAVDISNQLENEGLVSGKDFFIWDNMCIFHADEITKRYISFMSDIWKDKKRQSDRIILIPFDSHHDQLTVLNAYCSNYLAEKYDASIYGYCRFGVPAKNSSPVALDVYRSFNMVANIDSSLTKEQQKESEEILCALWENLYTWEDYKNITVYGICFGTTIIRDFLRENIPDYDLRSDRMYLFLKGAIDTIVFWYHYIQEHDIVTVLLADGVCWEGYIRDIAVTKGIPVYVQEAMSKAYLDYHAKTPFLYFKEMWKTLTPEEQQYGLEWAKEHINNRIKGNVGEVGLLDKNHFSFAEKATEERVLEDDEKIKIVICPHIFEEDSFFYGDQIFDNSYMSWLCHLGELSEKTPNYHWYIKVHPCARRRDIIIMENFVKHYPKIKMLPLHISPIQLKKEGVKFALTVHGTIGHEYPAIGIQVINAAVNPHSAYDFTWNPKTKEEYDDLIMNLDKLEFKDDKEGLYQFYCMHYLYYDYEYIPFRKMFFENPLLPMEREQLEVYGKDEGTWKYEEYMKEWTKEKHDWLWGKMESIFRKMDEWRPDVFYRRTDHKEGEI